MAAKRITENICMLFETHLLASFGQDVEKKLLGLAQENGGAVADDLLAQGEAVEREREATRAKKTRVAGALASLSRFAPNVVARPREGSVSAVTEEVGECVVIKRRDAFCLRRGARARS